MVTLQDAVRKGYGSLLERMGRNFVDFLRQLNNFYLPLSMGQTLSLPPDIRVEKVSHMGLKPEAKTVGIISFSNPMDN